MPPDARRPTSTTREELARLGANQEAAKEASTRLAVDLHRMLEGVNEGLRDVGDRMATAEQVHRLEDRIGDLDRRVTEHTPAVRAVPELREKVETLDKAVSAMAEAVRAVPALQQRQDAQEHRNSRLAGALWVVGVVVGLLGLAGLRDCGRWFVQAQAPAQHLPATQNAPEAAPPTRRR
ncbi:hypothetical protein OV208_15300 [Corallococcus sp. bb12-1]|uniref:hypothetical protein n=1 Tax=Corallococcus sp. bb12-1 TaxID=2996784 RepID=UPI0022719D0D|nr:hypothetical protein [Corallococcus sp. bb12-1]MCY1042690.1 hypothetical protein [Corallococcus sp. bb12-1]